VFLNGEYAADRAFYERLARSADLVVAADGGAERLADFGLRPDVAVGDFDSLSEDRLAQITAAGVHVRRHPVRKDQTDAELAVAEALRAGATVVDIAGALGGGFDHSLGSLALLRRLAGLNVAARLAEPGLSVTVAAAPRRVVLASQPNVRFSCLPLTARAVVSLAGFDWELDRVALRADRCRGVGNRVARAGAVVEVHAGAVVLAVEASDFDGEDTDVDDRRDPPSSRECRRAESLRERDGRLVPRQARPSGLVAVDRRHPVSVHSAARVDPGSCAAQWLVAGLHGRARRRVRTLRAVRLARAAAFRLCRTAGRRVWRGLADSRSCDRARAVAHSLPVVRPAGLGGRRRRYGRHRAGAQYGPPSAGSNSIAASMMLSATSAGSTA
jgi:thiamine pyrophosphokinase